MQSANDLLVSTYKYFNARDIDSVLKAMHEDVDWPNGMEGGRVHGHSAVRDYWTRQWGVVDPHVQPVSFATGPSGRTVVQVHQTVRDLEGKVILDRMVEHIYLIERGLIRSMEIRENEPS
jgi:SnoaL-like domain